MWPVLCFFELASPRTVPAQWNTVVTVDSFGRGTMHWRDPRGPLKACAKNHCNFLIHIDVHFVFGIVNKTLLGVCTLCARSFAEHAPRLARHGYNPEKRQIHYISFAF
jgi:hypothetical protein